MAILKQPEYNYTTRKQGRDVSMCTAEREFTSNGKFLWYEHGWIMNSDGLVVLYREENHTFLRTIKDGIIHEITYDRAISDVSAKRMARKLLKMVNGTS